MVSLCTYCSLTHNIVLISRWFTYLGKIVENMSSIVNNKKFRVKLQFTVIVEGFSKNIKVLWILSGVDEVSLMLEMQSVQLDYSKMTLLTGNEQKNKMRKRMRMMTMMAMMKYHLQLRHTMQRSVFSGDVNHRNDVCGRLVDIQGTSQ